MTVLILCLKLNSFGMRQYLFWLSYLYVCVYNINQRVCMCTLIRNNSPYQCWSHCNRYIISIIYLVHVWANFSNIYDKYIYMSDWGTLLCCLYVTVKCMSDWGTCLCCRYVTVKCISDLGTCLCCRCVTVKCISDLGTCLCCRYVTVKCMSYLGTCLCGRYVTVKCMSD